MSKQMVAFGFPHDHYSKNRSNCIGYKITSCAMPSFKKKMLYHLCDGTVCQPGCQGDSEAVCVKTAGFILNPQPTIYKNTEYRKHRKVYGLVDEGDPQDV